MSSVAELNRVLLIADHSDDEGLGCGGTIAPHADAGDEVQVLIVPEGAISRQAQHNRLQLGDELSALVQAAQTTGSILGTGGVELLDLPDNRLDLIKRLEEFVNRHQPQVVYVHYASDLNVGLSPSARGRGPCLTPYSRSFC